MTCDAPGVKMRDPGNEVDYARESGGKTGTKVVVHHPPYCFDAINFKQNRIQLLLDNDFERDS